MVLTKDNLAQPETIALFDFDGTITTRDSLFPFLLYASDTYPALKKLLKLTPQFVRYLFNSISRQEIKEKVLNTFFGGMPLAQLHAIGKSFAHSHQLKQLIRPQASKRIKWHQHQKHRCILVSASIDIYLSPWCEMMGFDDLISSKLVTDNTNVVTGQLLGANCWGPEKARRLLLLLNSLKNKIIYAYGDSRGDKEMLELANHAFFKKMPMPLESAGKSP